MMKGLILINAYNRMPEVIYQAERLKEEFENRGVAAEIRRNDFFAVSVANDLICNVKDHGFCVFLDKDKYVLRGLEKAGVPLFNGCSAIEVCDDKMTTYLALAGSGIEMPLTLPAIFCYTQDAEIAEESLDRIEGALGYPLVIKKSYGSCGAGVYLVRDRAELKAKIGELMTEPHLYQKYISASFGRDVRVLVIGKRVFGAILRKSENDFRSNVALGGTAEEYPLPESVKRTCERIAEVLGLDYCGIDLLFGEKGFLVCEVNSNAFFSGFERVTRKNVAGAYAEYIINTVTREDR